VSPCENVNEAGLINGDLVNDEKHMIVWSRIQYLQ